MFEPGAVSHLVTWQDGRCSSGFLASLPQPESHLRVASGFGCATIFWLLENRYGQLIFESGAEFPGRREWPGDCTCSRSASLHLLEHPSVRWPGTGCGRKTETWSRTASFLRRLFVGYLILNQRGKEKGRGQGTFQGFHGKFMVGSGLLRTASVLLSQAWCILP